MRPTTGQRWAGLFGWLADRPKGAAATATALLVILAALIRPPVIEGSLVEEMSGGNERLAIARRIAAAQGDRASIAIILEPRSITIESAFASIAELRRQLDKLGGPVIVRSIDDADAQLFAFGLTRASPLGELLAALATTDESAALIGASGDRFLLLIRLPRQAEQRVLQLLDPIDWRGYHSVTVLAASQLDRDVATSLGKDLRLLIPVIVAVTLLALLLAFGDWRALLLPFFASVASTIATFALFSVTVVTINLVTLIALPVVLIVGLANSCHFIAKSDIAVARDDDVVAGVRQTLQRVGPPFFFSTLTTAIALASLGLNELDPIANLGLLSAGALLVVFVLVLLAAPLSLRWYLGRSARSWQASRPYRAAMRWLARWRLQVSALLLLSMLGGAATIPLLSVKSDPRALFPSGAPFTSALRHFEEEFYFYSPLQVLVTHRGSDPLEGLRRAGQVATALAGLDGVRSVTTEPAVVTPAGDPGRAYVLTALLASQEHLDGARQLLESLPRESVEIVFSNATLVYGDIDRQAMESLLRSLGWSALLIFAAVLIVFRSLRAMLATMLANAVPLMFVCGAVWLIGNPLNLVTVFVFLVALGIIVDDSIHILFWRAAGDRVSGSSIEFSVLLSTFMLCLGLLLCQISDFATTREFAAYCALALVGAVISNLTVLPLLLGPQSDVEVLDG